MTARELRNVLLSVVLFTVAIIYGLRFISAITGVILLLAITLLIAFILNPIVAWGERHKIPRVVGAAFIALAALSAVGLLGWYMAPLVAEQFRALVNQAPAYFNQLRDWISNRAPGLAENLPTNAAQIVNRFGGLVGGVAGYAWNIIDIIASVLIVLVGTIYILANPVPLAQGLLNLFPQSRQETVVTVTRRIGDQMRAWALGTAIGMLVIFLLTWLALTIIDVQPAFLFAVIAGFLELVPLIGPIFSAVPPTLTALITNPVSALYVLAAFFIIQQLENHLIIPIVQSTSMRLHPLSIIFSILVMGGLFGIIGIFLAAPAAAIIKILYEELYLSAKHQDEDILKQRADQIVKNDQGKQVP